MATTISDPVVESLDNTHRITWDNWADTYVSNDVWAATLITAPVEMTPSVKIQRKSIPNINTRLPRVTPSIRTQLTQSGTELYLELESAIKVQKTSAQTPYLDENTYYPWRASMTLLLPNIDILDDELTSSTEVGIAHILSALESLTSASGGDGQRYHDVISHLVRGAVNQRSNNGTLGA
jgi:hypothetical protein